MSTNGLARFWQLRSDEFDEWCVLGKNRVDRFDDGLYAVLTFSSEPLFQWPLGPHRLVQTLGEGDSLDALSLLVQSSLEERDLFPKLELLFRVVPEKCVWHIVIGAQLCARIG